MDISTTQPLQTKAQGTLMTKDRLKRLSEADDMDVCYETVFPRNDREPTSTITQQDGCVNKT